MATYKQIQASQRAFSERSKAEFFAGFRAWVALDLEESLPVAGAARAGFKAAARLNEECGGDRPNMTDAPFAWTSYQDGK